MSHFELHKPIEHLPSIKTYTADRLTLELAIPHDRVWQNMTLVTSQYKYPSPEDWPKIFANVCKGLPKFSVPTFECLAFALEVKIRVHKRFKINAIAIARGVSPLAAHDHFWNWFYDELGWHQLEPQNGDVFGIDEEGYISKWLLG